MRTPEEIILSKGIKFSEKRSPRDFNLTIIAMKEYASQFYSEEQVRGAIRLARMRSAFGEMGHYIHSHSEEKIIEMVKSSEQPKESTTFSSRTTR